MKQQHKAKVESFGKLLLNDSHNKNVTLIWEAIISSGVFDKPPEKTSTLSVIPAGMKYTLQLQWAKGKKVTML